MLIQCLKPQPAQQNLTTIDKVSHAGFQHRSLWSKDTEVPSNQSFIYFDLR